MGRSKIDLECNIS